MVKRFFDKLGNKIVGILVAFFLLAMTAIGMTLVVSWQFEGGAAAINDAGSERMRSYRMAFLLSQAVHGETPKAVMREELRREVALFEQTLKGLEQGDPSRPLFLPKNKQVQAQMAELQQHWQYRIKPLLEEIQNSSDRARQKRLMAAYQPEVESFVKVVNELVLLIERDNFHKTSLLRTIQLGLIALALAGTILLIYLMYLLIIQPVMKLQDGIKRMAAEDFSVRLPVESRDEFGELAVGFNQMANNLEDLYSTMEQRVEAKTRSLEGKNRELALLYETTTFLNEPSSVEELCHGFMRRMMRALGAQGGAVRLIDPNTQKIHLVAFDGMSANFARDEACLDMGQCLCGGAAQEGVPVFWNFNQPAMRPLLYNCRREGYQVVSAFTIRAKKQVIGIFNLYFYEGRSFNAHETQLMETLGQHLGVAIENQRLVSREKEMAVSEERNLLAQELHDSIAQALAFLNIQAQLLQDSLKRANIEEAMEGLAQIREGIQESYDDVRELLVHFRTRVHQADLESAIKSALEKFEGQTGVATSFRQSGTGIPLAPEFEIQVLHIVQEALSNVRKHSGATRVEVETNRDGAYNITVCDNGRGFDPDDVGDRAETHVGLKIMKERAHRIGGVFEINSTPGRGTVVRLSLPRVQMEAA
ncbi:MAG: type IV pili methyl-accepting chemotaxis transducer N-terminal domain-containing protein [Pseudomonadota bacterium]|jgi:two-component system nitrate/nitrite sensor histidine kinase NarX